MSQLYSCSSAVECSLCCHPYVSGEKAAPDPEHLMRSCHHVFVTQDADYLIKTQCPSCGTAALQTELIAEFAHAEWLELTVFEHYWQDGGSIGFVSFVIRLTEGGKTGAIIECSRFLKEDGQWHYIDGIRPQFGRNDLCPCGSGRKFKRCCGQ